MKRKIKTRMTAIAIGIALAISTAYMGGQSLKVDGLGLLMSTAVAAQGDGGQKGNMGGGGGQAGGGQGIKGGAGQERGGGKSTAQLLSEDSEDDSDRPDWAQGNKEANPHSGDPNPTPGDTKGDDYGDLYVVLRNPVTGEPILDGDELQICLDPACTDLASTVDGEVPAGVTPLEVDFGRLNIGRSPTSVIQHAEDEVLSKITSATTLAVDEAGRIVVDGATIDSPLENLAIYIAIINKDATVLEALEDLNIDPMQLAAAALGGAGDKTGDITVDMLFYSNVIYNLVPAGEDYVDYSSFSYDRTLYDRTVDYFYMDGDEVKSATVDLMAYLEETPIPDGTSGITLFSIAADDALEIVELIHTQIHEALLPGTVVAP